MTQNTKKQGQGTLEYLIMLAGVIAVLLVFMGPGGFFQQSFNQTLAMSSNSMVTAVNMLTVRNP